MPRTNAIPPSILLAPTAVTNPAVPLADAPEAATRNVEVQTMYRESEAQTNPYSPEYFLAPGAQPEILLLQGLKANEGLPIGNREVEMIAQARLKKELESNALPMTDEACFFMRKRMMENQEIRELRIREAELDAKFEERLNSLQQALEERADTHEFLASQRVESIRQARMDEREKVLQSIRKSRIQVLRRLARKRNEAEPMLSGTAGRDIINEYYDRGSKVYAPLKRDGATVIGSKSTVNITAHTVQINNLQAMTALEEGIPNRFRAVSPQVFNPEKKLMSKTWSKGGGRAAEPRLTSAAVRSERKTKTDIDTMHQIILAKKRKTAAKYGGSGAGYTAPGQTRSAAASGPAAAGADVLVVNPAGPGTAGGLVAPSAIPSSPPISPTVSPTARKSAPSTLLAGKPKGRPDTPDIAARTDAENAGHALKSAMILLQKLVRGRAIQNKMFEGRIRNKELINEMRQSDEQALLAQEEMQSTMISNTLRDIQVERVLSSTMSSIVGSLSSNAFVFFAQEHERNKVIDKLIAEAHAAYEIRCKREAFEAGRRQKEMVPLEYPYGLNGAPPMSFADLEPHQQQNGEEEELVGGAINSGAGGNQEEEAGPGQGQEGAAASEVGGEVS